MSLKEHNKLLKEIKNLQETVNEVSQRNQALIESINKVRKSQAASTERKRLTIDNSDLDFDDLKRMAGEILRESKDNGTGGALERTQRQYNPIETPLDSERAMVAQ